MILPKQTNNVTIHPGIPLSSLACRHCSAVMVQPALVALLAKLPAFYHDAYVISCGYRCPAHNAAVGGVSDSQHLLGAAVDLVPHDGDTKRLAVSCKAAGFPFVLDEGDHVHADARGMLP